MGQESLVEVRVVTPEGLVFEGKGSSVSLFSREDSLAVWPGHINLLALTDRGSVVLKTESGPITWPVGPGSVTVGKNKVTFLVEHAGKSPA